ncbi:MAG: META domain-containing protein [Rikenellaceae bacterium]|nr:META domain-containing protein [Rikenellaceae bacterium]
MKVFIKTVAAVCLAAALVGCKSGTPKKEITAGMWTMTSWMDDEGDEMTVTQNRPTMEFTDDSRVYGNAGCNNFNGTYKIDGDQLTVDMGAMNLKMCLDMTVEDRMVRQMPNVTRYEIDGNQLILFNSAGRELFRFDNTVKQDANNQ